MTEEWPPEGYSQAREYDSSDRWMIAIGLLLIFPVFGITREDVGTSVAYFVEWSGQIGESVGLSTNPMLLLIVVLLALLFWIIASAGIIIILHEGIHYAFGLILGVNPHFEFHTQVFLPNPTVVAYDEGIARYENIAMIIGPFVILSILCGSLMWMTSGFVAATAAIMFAINAVPSCGDLYHFGRIAMLPRGTLFANFDEDKGLRTEYTTPESGTRAT